MITKVIKSLIPFLLISPVFGQAVFPNNVATHSTLLNLTNFYQSNLVSAISSNATLLTVTNARSTILPNSVITIDTEAISICGVTGNILTVCSGGRGFDNSLATSHNAGSQLRGSIVAFHHNQMANEVIAIENALGVNLSKIPVIPHITNLLKGDNIGGVSPAFSADIVSLFSGCIGTYYLGADGNCHNPPSAGSVTSIGLSLPSWLQTSQSSITSSGTFTVTPAASQTSHQVIGTCGSTSTFAPCSLLLSDIPTGYSYSNLSGVPTFVTSAFLDTTNAANISSGILPHARMPTLLLTDIPTGYLYSNLTGKPTFATSATTDTTNANNIVSGTLSHARLPSLILSDMPNGYLYSNLSGVPALSASATTDTTNASNITSGTLAHGRLPSLLLTDIPTGYSYSNLIGSPTLSASATTDTTNAANITSGTLSHSRLPTLLLADIPTGYLYSHLSGVPALATSATTDTTNATNISSGTLPHARLPILLSADIPNNASNTTGNAATATAFQAIPTQCASGNYTIGIDINGNSQSCTPFPTIPSTVAIKKGDGTGNLSDAVYGVDYNNEIDATYVNETVTGTVINKLVKLTGNPTTAIITSTSDSGGVIGIAMLNTGITGSVQVALSGTILCAFDGATVANDYVQISSVVAGDCHDNGSSYPAAGQVIGRVLSTNATAGYYPILLFAGEIQASAGGGSGSGLSSVQNNAGSDVVLNPTVLRVQNGVNIGWSISDLGGGIAGISPSLLPLADSTSFLGRLLASNITAPTTPVSGVSAIYVDSTSKNLAVKNDLGVVSHAVQSITCGTQFVSAINDAGLPTCTAKTVMHNPGVTFVNGSQVLSGSTVACRYYDYAGTITKITMISDVAGSGVVDIKAISHASYTGPSSTVSITGSSIPTLTGAIKYQDSTLTGWTTSWAADSDVCYFLSAPSTVTQISLTLDVVSN